MESESERKGKAEWQTDPKSIPTSVNVKDAGLQMLLVNVNVNVKDGLIMYFMLCVDADTVSLILQFFGKKKRWTESIVRR